MDTRIEVKADRDHSPGSRAGATLTYRAILLSLNVQCEPASSVCFANPSTDTTVQCAGESAAVKYAKWMFTGPEATESMKSLGAAPSSSRDRVVALAALTFDCNPVPDIKIAVASKKTDDTPFIAGIGAGVMLCILLVGGWYIRRERRRMKNQMRRVGEQRGHTVIFLPFTASSPARLLVHVRVVSR
jgi:hypothetical protein